MMLQPPLVSIVIPTHNRHELVLESLESVVAQTVDEWEAIVVDDGSHPPLSFESLTAKFGPRVRGLRHETARGGAAAKNTGIRASRGRFIAFLDDDDVYAPGYLARALHVFEAHPQIQALFMAVSWFGLNAEWQERAYHEAMQGLLQEAGSQQLDAELLVFDSRLFSALLGSVPMAFQRPVIRREALERTGVYQEGLLLWDCDWALRAALEVSVALNTEPLYRQRAGHQGFSSQPSRRLDHLVGGAAMKEALVKSCASHNCDGRIQKMVQRAAAASWYSLAYYYCHSGALAKSLAAWRKSQQHAFDPKRIKLLLKILYYFLVRPGRRLLAGDPQP